MSNSSENQEIIMKDFNDIMNSEKATNMIRIFQEFYYPNAHSDIKNTMNEQTMSNVVNHKSDSIKYKYLGKTDVSEKDIEDMRRECATILENFEKKYRSYGEYHEYEKSLQEMFESYHIMMRDKRKENIKMIYQKCIEQFKNEINSVSFNNTMMEYIDCNQREELSDKMENTKREIIEQIMNIAKKHNLDDEEYTYVIHDVMMIIDDTYEKCDSYIKNNEEHFQEYEKMIEKYHEEVVNYFKNLIVSKIGKMEMTSKKKMIKKDMKELIEKYKQEKIEYEHTYIEPKYFREMYQTKLYEIYENEYELNIDNILYMKFQELIDQRKGQRSIFARCEIAESSLPTLNIDDENVFEQLPNRDTYISHKVVDKLIEISELCGKDIYYFGKTFGYTIAKKKKIYSIELIEKMSGIKYEEDIPSFYIINDKVKSEMFSNIKRDDMKNTVYIFSPNDIDMYNKFMTYMEAYKVKNEIERYFSL
jgi:hypothetical protein